VEKNDGGMPFHLATEDAMIEEDVDPRHGEEDASVRALENN
jgi:hypothetical protein